MKKHIRNFGGFRNRAETLENINEHVIQVDNTYQVSVIAKVEAKLISAYAKKVEQNTGIKVADVYGNNQLAELIVVEVGYEGQLIFDTTKFDGTPRKLMDSSKINCLGWTPKINLLKGLKNTINDFISSVNTYN